MYTRTRILEAAAGLFYRDGYVNTTVRDLANEVGLQSGSIFHHFGTKQAILTEIVDKDTAVLRARVRDVDHEDTDIGRLSRFMRTHVRTVLDDLPHLVPLILREWLHLSSESRDATTTRLHDHTRQLATILQGLWTPSLPPPDNLAEFLIGAANDRTWRSPEQRVNSDSLAEMLIALVTHDKTTRSFTRDKTSNGGAPRYEPA